MDVDDLIRETDEALTGIVSTPWSVWPNDEYWCSFDFVQDGYEDSSREEVDKTSTFIAAAPDLVRRLRDALEASQADLTEMSEEFIQEWVDHRKSRQDLTEARAAIARVQALCDDKSAGPLYENVVRRAIEGEQ